MTKSQFKTYLNKIIEHNNYPERYYTTDACDTIHKWTPCDLIIREYLNNGGGSSRGFLGINPSTCEKLFFYIREHSSELIADGFISETGWNNCGVILWQNYKF